MKLAKSVSAGLLPIVFFKLFMLATDHHQDRTEEPYGLDVMVENFTTLLAADFGPVANVYKGLLPQPTQHFEGHTYLGLATIVLLLIYFGLLVTRFRKLSHSRAAASLLIASGILLLVAFGWHRSVLSALNISSPALNQFRAVSRFAYFIYYALPVFLISALYREFIRNGNIHPYRNLRIMSAAFVAVSLFETHFYFTRDQHVYWKYRNIFNSNLLNQEEKAMLKNLQRNSPGAILPLPIFHGGSEVYERAGSNNSYIPSMLYSYHSGLPIFSVLMSRTSISETEKSLDILNTYKKNRPGLQKLDDRSFFVIKTRDLLLPDEERISRRVEFSKSSDTLSFGFLEKSALLSPVYDSAQIRIKEQEYQADNLIYFHTKNARPFSPANMNDYEKIYSLDAGNIRDGNYIVSFHHHYSGRTYKGLACNLIITETCGESFQWKYNVPVRLLSGFYEGYGVFEYPVTLKSGCKYEFLLKGFIDQTYYISDFMLRPSHVTVIMESQENPVVNNFPERQ